MSLLDNIKGRGGDDGDPAGKFNPFRLLEIGEIMVRYTDGIRIKDFVFLAILTSERLILIDSARQGTGQITKEIPFSVIKQADLERDERDRPTLAISMDVGGQSRVMRLVFTGLIAEPETECREWFTAINGYPPERMEQPEIRLDEPAEAQPVTPVIPVAAPSLPPEPSQVRQEVPPSPPLSPAVSPPPVIPVQSPTPVPSPEPVVVQAVTPVPPQPPVQAPTPVVPPVQQVVQVPVVTPPADTPLVHPGARRPVPSTPPAEGSVRIFIEKPDISPLRMGPGQARDSSTKGSKSWKYCIQCGGRIVSQSRYCQICGSPQS